MHQSIAFRTAYLLTGSAADAEEAAQTAFVKAWSALPRFRRGAPFRPWLLRIVANEAHNRRRAAGRRAAFELRAAEALPADATPSPEGAAIDAASVATSSSRRSSAWTSVTATSSRAATSSSSPRRRPPQPWTCAAGR